MVKSVKEYTKEELEEEIVKIKTERERTAEALKKYEEELERRKRKVPLGVPDAGEFFINGRGYAAETSYEYDIEAVNFNSFSSLDSACKHSEMLLAWRKDGLLANSKGEPIDIKVLLPLLPKGWVCMNEACNWVWCNEKPEILKNNWTTKWKWNYLTPFNLKPADDWKTSLMECGL